jgi:RNA polymerase sigma-70 factor (ECF subfamily)
MTLKVSTPAGITGQAVVMADGPDTFVDMEHEQTSRPGAPSAPASGLPCGGAPEDRAAFLDWVGRLVHEHRASLARVARREGLSPEDAFDAVQEAFHTFITLPRARALVDEADPSRKLLVTLTRNVARNRRRLHASARPHDDAALDQLPADGPTVEDTITAAEEHLQLAGCLSTLAEVQRAVVTLRMLDQVPGEDVARELGITPGHVAVLLHRAKANLLACMLANTRR